MPIVQGDASAAPVRTPAARLVAACLVVGLLALVPVYASLGAQPSYLTLFSRIMIYGLAALGLNLVLGWGAMVSFGHSLYIGIGAYAVGMLSAHGIDNGFAHLGVGLAAGLAASLLIGLICLRTGGIAFIMITLAFAQMAYFLAVGLKNYGGDDGLPIAGRSTFGPLDLDNNLVLYYLIFAVLIATLYAFHRLVHSRFGMVLRGSKSNPRRMAALGFATLPYQLAAYVVSALVCVLAGMLLANLTSFASPAYMQWSVSGELIAMIVLGGLGSLLGPVVGAAVWLLLEEVLSSARLGLPWGLDDMLHDHWMLLLGAIVVLVTLGLKQGLYGWLLEPRK